MNTTDLSAITPADSERIADICEAAGIDIKDCYQCGKCSAGCPMAHAMDLLPQQVMRNLQLGLVEAVLEAKSPWICAGCEVCATRCPQNIEITSLMQAVRRASKASGHTPVRESDLFDDIFVGNIRTYGKSNETRLAAKFNLRSGHFFQDVANVPAMMSRGMVGPAADTVHDRAAVRALFDRVLKGGDDA